MDARNDLYSVRTQIWESDRLIERSLRILKKSANYEIWNLPSVQRYEPFINAYTLHRSQHIKPAERYALHEKPFIPKHLEDQANDN